MQSRSKREDRQQVISMWARSSRAATFARALLHGISQNPRSSQESEMPRLRCSNVMCVSVWPGAIAGPDSRERSSPSTRMRREPHTRPAIGAMLPQVSSAGSRDSALVFVEAFVRARLATPGRSPVSAARSRCAVERTSTHMWPKGNTKIGPGESARGSRSEPQVRPRAKPAVADAPHAALRTASTPHACATSALRLRTPHADFALRTGLALRTPHARGLRTPHAASHSALRTNFALRTSHFGPLRHARPYW